MGEQVRRLRRFAPQIVTGQTTCLEAVARHLREAGEVLDVDLVVSRGEVLPFHTRELLNTVFSGRVVDYYNCEEIGNVAYECPVDASHMHVNTDCCVLEIVDEEGEAVPLGIEGRAVVTNLFNHTMPFIRYDLGDRATMVSSGGERCACGSRRPKILIPSGRADDFFRFSDGRQIAPRTAEAYVVPPLFELMAQHNPVVVGSPTYRIIQEDEWLVRVQVSDRLAFREELRGRVESGFRNAGYDIRVVVEDGCSMPAVAGKHRRMISKVELPESTTRTRPS